MSNETFCLFTELNAIKESGNTDVNTLIPAIKEILMKERESEGFKTLRGAPFGMVKMILDNQGPEFDIEIKCIEAKEEIKNLKESYSIGKYDSSIVSTLLILHYNSVKPIIGERFFTIMKDVFEDSYEHILSEMEKEILVMMTDVLSEFPYWSSSEKHKKDFCAHYKEKYENSYFEKLVYDFVNNYLENGKPVPMAINSKIEQKKEV